jgi:hypothetical protein
MPVEVIIVSAPTWFKRPIRPGDTGPDVTVVLRKLGLDPDEPFGDLAVARSRASPGPWGSSPMTAWLTRRIASALGEAATPRPACMPEWFSLRLGDTGTIVARAARLLGQDTDVFTAEMEAPCGASRAHHGSNRLASSMPRRLGLLGDL